MRSNTKLLLIVFAFFTAIASITFSCQHSDERNTLSFQAPATEVIDSLQIMRNFVWNLSEYLDRESGYYIDKGRFYNNLFIEGRRVVNVEDLRKALMNSGNSQDTAVVCYENEKEITSMLSDKALARFIALSIYLDDNYISSSYIDKYFDAVVFGYRDTLISDDQDVRRIILIDDIKDSSAFYNEVRIYEKMNDIVLFSPYK